MNGAAPDPRVARTRRDVVDATASLLAEGGWESVTHAEVARRAGYAKATVYAHWPTRLDLVRDAIERICDVSKHPAPTGELRADLHASLADFANDLATGHLGRLLAGVIEHGHDSEIAQQLRLRLYDTGTHMMRSVLRSQLSEHDVDPSLVLLTGGVFTRVTFEGKPATASFIDDLIDRVLRACTPRTSATQERPPTSKPAASSAGNPATQGKPSSPPPTASSPKGLSGRSSNS